MIWNTERLIFLKYMFNLRGSLSSCLTVVAFLVLAVLATRFYGDTNGQTNLDKSANYQKGQAVVNTIWSYAKVIASVNLIKNVGVGNATLEENIKNGIKNSDLAVLGSLNNNPNNLKNSNKVSGLNSYDIENNRPLTDLTGSVGNNNKTDSGRVSSSNTEGLGGDLNGLENFDFKSSVNSILNYRKTAEGAEIIIKSKSGSEFKLALPFKFLADIK